MSNPKPINASNAIEAVAFVVIFDRAFTEEEENKLLTLEELLKKDLPKFSQDTKFEARLEKGDIVKQTARKAGIKLQKIEESGKVGWMLHIMENQLVVTCRAYNRWENVWKKTDKFITASVKCMNLDTLKIQACILQYVDQFIENNKNYDLYEIFDKKTPFLTKKAAEVGQLWHVHQGWFDEISKEKKLLNVLNLGTRDEGKDIATTIDHVSHMQFISPMDAKKFFAKGKSKPYEKEFVFLHKNNKTVIKNVLNTKQKKAVGLV